MWSLLEQSRRTAQTQRLNKGAAPSHQVEPLPANLLLEHRLQHNSSDSRSVNTNKQLPTHAVCGGASGTKIRKPPTARNLPPRLAPVPVVERHTSHSTDRGDSFGASVPRKQQPRRNNTDTQSTGAPACGGRSPRIT